MRRFLGYAGKVLLAAIIAAIIKTVIEHQTNIRLGGVPVAAIFLGSYFVIDILVKRFRPSKGI